MTTALQRRQTLLPPVSPAERAAARGARITPDYRLDELKLDPEDKSLSSVAIAPVLTDGTLTLTIVGASTIEIDLADHDKTLLTGNFLTRWLWGENADHRDDAAWILHGRKILVQLDDLAFRLRRLQKNETRILTLEVEDIVASDLRATAGPKVATRGTAAGGGITRAQFVQSMCKEAGVASYIPELTDPQPIQPVSTSTTTSKSQRKQRGQKGLDRSAHITVKGAKANPQQLRNIEIALDEGTKQRAPDLALLAALCAGTGESGFESIPNTGGSNYTGVFQGSKNLFKATDTQKEAYWFFHGGKGFQAGGAIHQARSNPSQSAGSIANVVEAGGAGAGFYNVHLPEAKRTLAAYKPGISNTGTTSITVEKAFQFTRGKQENSWDAIQRLAQEVQWRAFVRRHPITGQQALWYVSDQFLSEQVPAMTVWEHRPDRPSAVEAITHTVDLGARNAAADLAITARVGRWTALPGMRVIVDEEGPADGGWLVQDVTRPLWDPVAVITCTKPIPSLAEPAPQTETLTFNTGQAVPGGKSRGGAFVGGIYAVRSNARGQDRGFDFAGRGPMPAFADGKITFVQARGSGWPLHAEGDRAGALICQQLDTPVRGVSGTVYHYIYYAENINPQVRVGQRVTAGTVIAHANGTFAFTEQGFAADSRGTTWASAHGQGRNIRNGAGHDFQVWIGY